MIPYIMSFIFVIALDLYTKYLVYSNLNVGQSIPIINGFFDLCYVQNTGASFGIFAGKIQLLSLFTGILVLVLITYAIIFRKKLVKLEFIALSFVSAGGLGNLISRLTQGFVTDMLDFHFWPVFNVADIFICVGCGLLILSAFFSKPNTDGK